MNVYTHVYIYTNISEIRSAIGIENFLNTCVSLGYVSRQVGACTCVV